MAGFRKGLLVVLICALMVSIAPAAMAAATPSYGSVVGVWSGSDGYNAAVVLALYDDGYYEIYVSQSGNRYDQYGYYSMDSTAIYFSPNNAPMAAYSYWCVGDTLTLTDWQTGDTIYLDRADEQELAQSTAPAALVGAWSGQDGDDTVTLSLSSDFTFVIMYASEEGYETGEFSEYGGVLTLSFTDGTSLEFKYMLSGDTLFLADEESGLTATLKRLAPDNVSGLAPTAAPEPVVTIMPEPVATAAPEPVVTAAPEPVQVSANLAGSWKGEAAGGPIAITMSPDGKIGIVQAEGVRTGSYASDASAIRVSFEDGTALTYRFILMGDTLLLTDEQLGNPITLTREVEQQPQPQPPAQLDPAVFGTWGGFDKGEYGELTLAPDGAASMFVPSDPASPTTGTYTASEGAISIKMPEVEMAGTYEVAGDSFKLTREDGVTEFTRVAAPLTRVAAVEEPVVGTVDAALVGTWGGTEGGAYAEFTFSGGGAFSKFVPEDDAKSAAGTFMASGGTVAVLLPTGALQGTYAVDGDSLTVTWIGAEAAVYARQAGPLTR